MLNGAPLNAVVALENKLQVGGVGIGEDGFFMSPDYETAELFGFKRSVANRSNKFLVLGLLFSSDAFGRTLNAGGEIRKVAGMPPQMERAFNHFEVVLFPSAFPTFNNFRSQGKIVVFNAGDVSDFRR